MGRKLKKCVLVFCLFTFLLIVLGGGLHLNPGGAFLAAATGTPLLIYAFNCVVARSPEFTLQPEESKVSYGGREPVGANRRR